MAKKSVVVRNQKKLEKAAKQRMLRKELRKLSVNPHISEEERLDARYKLQSLSPNSADVRTRRRCLISGRGRGVYRKFQMSRIVIRDFAHKGWLPGVTKASW